MKGKGVGVFYLAPSSSSATLLTFPLPLIQRRPQPAPPPPSLSVSSSPAALDSQHLLPAAAMRPQLADPMSTGSSSASYGGLSLPPPAPLLNRSMEVTKYGALTGLPLPACPKCGDEIIELRCGASSKTPGQIFFKCRLHERNDPSSCLLYLYYDKYQRWLLHEGYIGDSVSKMAGPNICAEARMAGPNICAEADIECLKRQLEVMQNGVDAVKKDVEGVKAAVDQLDGKCGKLMDIAILGVGCHVLVIVFVVAVLFAVLFK